MNGGKILKFCYAAIPIFLLCGEYGVLADFLSRVNHPCVAPADGQRRGHNDKLGCQRSTVGSLYEYLEAPSPQQLWENQVSQYKPAVIRNALNGSSALNTWSDEYLRATYGDQEVLVEKKYEDRKSEPKRMSIKEFLENYHKRNWYVVSLLPNAMRKDIRIPKPLMCSTFRKQLAELNLWIGTNGTRSMLHYDADNILHCVVSGWKDWILFHPMYKPKLDMVLGSENQGSGFSHLNVDNIDENLNPEVWDTPWEYVTLRRGDCLYLPARYLHQVRSYERSISVTFLFYPEGSFSDEDCKDINFNDHQSLQDAYVYWTLENGQETIDMGYMNPELAKKSFLVFLELIGKKAMDFKTFVYSSIVVEGEQSLEAGNKLIVSFRKFDQDDDGLVTKTEIKNADIETWKSWCRDSDKPHGPKKSQLHKNQKLTSKTADFVPRPGPDYIDSWYAMIFLKFVITAVGTNDQITYTEFKKHVEVRNGTSADAFIIFDKNFDGVITFKELENASKKHLRDFSKSYYALKGTNIRGGGISTDEVEENDLRYLEKLKSIPTSSMAAFDEREEIYLKTKVLDEILQKLMDVALTQTHVNTDSFFKAVQSCGIAEVFELEKMDIGFLFEIFDRGNKGYISQSDIRYYIANQPIYLYEKDTASYGGQIKIDLAKPYDIIIKTLSSMDFVDEFLEESNENGKIESSNEHASRHKQLKSEL